MDDSQPAVQLDVQHYAGVLRQAVRAAGFTVTEVERRLGTGPKALRRVLCGEVDLKFKHVIAVLRIIGMSEKEFFSVALRSADRRRRQRSSGGDLLATFSRLGYGKFAPTADDHPDASDAEFDRLVDEAVDRVLQRRAREGLPPAGQLLTQEEGGRDHGGDGESL